MLLISNQIVCRLSENEMRCWWAIPPFDNPPLRATQTNERAFWHNLWTFVVLLFCSLARTQIPPVLLIIKSSFLYYFHHLLLYNEYSKLLHLNFAPTPIVFSLSWSLLITIIASVRASLSMCAHLNCHHLPTKRMQIEFQMQPTACPRSYSAR